MRAVFRLNQKGVSLVESLVAIAVLAGIAVVIAQSNLNFQPATLGIKRTCQSHAQSVLNVIQEETYYRNVVNFVPDGPLAGDRTANRYIGAGDAPTAAMQNPPLGNLWFTGPAAAFVISPAAPVPAVPDVEGVELQNFQLIQGTMRTLATIYNNVGLGCGFVAYAPLTTQGGAVPWPNELVTNNAVIDMRIQPYDRRTGNAACALPAIYPAPLGGAAVGVGGDGVTGPAALNTNPLFSAFAAVQPGVGANVWAPPANAEGWDAGSPPAVPSFVNYRMATRGLGTPTDADANEASYGFEVTIRVQYTHNGVADQCSVTQKFEYPVDRTPPPPPTVAVTTNSTYPAALPARPNCQVNVVPPIQITISQNVAEQERGVQYLCRDLSWFKNWNTNPGPPYTQPPCIRGGTVMPDEIQYDDDPAGQTSARVNYWVPCDIVQQCGVSPTATYPNGNPNSDGTLQTLVLDYPANAAFMSANGRQACVFNMEVVAVDTAGNTSIAGVAANRSFLEVAVPLDDPTPANQPITRTPPDGTGNGATRVGRRNEVLHPTCGTFCAPPAAPSASNWVMPDQFPNGYWTCRAAGSGPDVNAATVCCEDPGRTTPGDGLCTAYN